MKPKILFALLFFVLFFAENPLRAQGSAILLSKKVIKSEAELFELYNSPTKKPISFSALQDSLLALSKMMKEIAVAKDSLDYDDLIFPNLYLVEKVKTYMENAELCMSYRGSCFDNEFFNFLCCAEKQQWERMDDILISKVSYTSFQKYILPQVPGANRKAVRFLIDLMYLEKMHINIYTKDSPQNLETIEFLDNVWNQLQDPALQKELNVNEIMQPYINGDKKEDSLRFTLLSQVKSPLYEKALKLLIDKYSILALHFEDLEKVKNGYVLPLKEFMTTKIEASKSPYLRTLAMTQILLNKGWKLDEREDLNSAYLYATEPNNYCQKLLNLYIDKIVTNEKAYELASLQIASPEYYVLLKQHALLFDKKNCNDLIVEKGRMLMSILRNNNDAFNALALMTENQVFNKVYASETLDSIIKLQIDKAVLQVIDYDNDTLIYKGATSIIENQYQRLSASEILAIAQKATARIKNKTFSFSLNYETLSLLIRRKNDSHCEHIALCNVFLQSPEMSTDTTLRISLNGVEYRAATVIEKAWTAYNDALDRIYNLPENYVYDRAKDRYIKDNFIPVNAKGAKKAQINCTAYAADMLVPDWLENDKKLLESDYFMQKNIENNGNYLHFLTNFLQKTLRITSAVEKNLDAFLYWEQQRISLLKKYIVFSDLAERNELTSAQWETLRQKYNNNEAVWRVYEELITIQKDSADLYDPEFSYSLAAFRWNRLKAMNLLASYKQLFPKNYDLKHPDLLPDTFLGLEYPDIVASEQPFQILIHTQNIDTFYVHIQKYYMVDSAYLYKPEYWEKDTIGYVDYIPVRKYDEKAERYLKIPYKSQDDKYNRRVELLLPALATGDYEIKISDAEANAVASQTIDIKVSPVWILGRDEDNVAWTSSYTESPNKLRHYYFLNRTTGEPLRDLTILYKNAENEYNKDTKSYAGFYFVPKDAPPQTMFLANTEAGLRVSDSVRIYGIVYRGDTVMVEPEFSDQPMLEEETSMYCEIFTDRAIYRSGQELKFKVVLLKAENGKAAVCADCSVDIELYNFKGESLSTKYLETNYFGSASGVFTLDENLIGGDYYLQCSKTGKRKNIRIEAYKRPSFNLNFKAQTLAHNLGDSICFEAEATALAGYPIAGATVKYRLDLQLQANWYDITLDEITGYDFDNNPKIQNKSQDQLLSSTIETDSVGQFKVCFQSQKLKYDVPSMVYNYRFSADITDKKGETQSGEQALSLSHQPFSINLSKEEIYDLSKRNVIDISLRNSSNLPQPAAIEIKLYREKTAAHFKDYRLWSNPTDTLITALELEKQSPYSPHWREETSFDVATAKMISSINLKASSDYQFELPNTLTEGKYRIELTATDSSGKISKKSESFACINYKSNKMPWSQAFFTQCSQDVYRQKENFTIYLGSSYPEGAKMLLYINRLDSVLYHQWHSVSGKSKIEVPLAKMPLGDYSYMVYMVLNNRIYEASGDFVVQANLSKKLKVEILEYKKKYEPGERISIKIKVTDEQGKPVAAEITSTIYDAALEKFAKHRLAFDDFSALQRFPLMRMDNRYKLYYDNQLSIKKSDKFDQEVTLLLLDSETYSDLAVIKAPPTSLSDKLGNKPKPKPKTEKAEKKNMLRTDLDETIFWETMAVSSSEDGIAYIECVMNDALTNWNAFFALHTANAESGNAAISFVSNKPLMIQPNIPRFVRQNDTIIIAALLVNQDEKALKGNVSFKLLDATTQKPLKGFLLQSATQKFNLGAKKSQAFEWKIVLPDTAKTVLYKIVAKARNLEDGEQGQLLVLSDKSIEINQQNVSLRGPETKMLQLPADSSSRSKPVQLKLNVSYNLSWDVLQSLPSLIENPYECSEQLCNRIYSNALAGNIISKNPNINLALEYWRKNGRPLPIELSDPALKEKIKMQTAWAFDLADDDLERVRFARLLDAEALEAGKSAAYEKLLSRQLPSGGLSWYGGPTADNYITMYVLQMLGHYKKLSKKNLLPDNSNLEQKAFAYTKNEFLNQYQRWNKISEMVDGNMDKLDIRPEHLNFLYTATFYEETKDTSVQNFILNLLEKQWQSFSQPISLGHIALTFYRNGRIVQANMVLDTLLQRSLTDKENGRFWFKDYGYYWYNAPIETQALLIEAFAEIRPKDEKTLEQMKTWLLLQREGASWATSKATAAAATALMLGSNWIAQNALPDILLNDSPVTFSSEELECNPGKLSKVWKDESTLRNTRAVSIKNNNETPLYATLAMYKLKPLSEIKATADTSFRVEKFMYRALPNGGWELLSADAISTLKKGDKIRIDLALRVPKFMEYVHLYDQHPSGFEPISTKSEMHYESGAAHYRDVRDAVTNFFFANIDPGSYTISREFFVANAGAYQSGMATMECMYAPKFKAHTGSTLLKAE